MVQWNKNLFLACMLLSVLSSGAFAAATVTAVSPASGTLTGGQTVVITGTGFSGTSGAANVTFGGTNATSYVVISATQIQAVTPAHAIGAVNVVVNNGGAGTLNNGYTYTTANTTLQVTVRVTIPKRADIIWGAATSADDTPLARAGTILPFVWVVKDAALGNFADVASTYLSNTAPNSKTLAVSNVSKTNSQIILNCIATDTANWTNTGSIATADQFRIRAQLSGAGNTQQVVLPTPSVNLTNATLLSVGTDQTLVIEVTTPPTISAASAAVTQISTVTLIATPN